MSGNIGAKIKTLRKSLNLTLEDFGKMVYNTSKGNVHKWENNITKPSKKNLTRIAELANQSLEDFLSDETIGISIFEVNLLLSENEQLEQDALEKQGYISDLFRQITNLQLSQEVTDEPNPNIKYLEGIVADLENEIESIYNLIKENVIKIAEIQQKISNSNSNTAQKILQENLISLENLLNSSYPLTINEKELTDEDKIRALEILKLVFK